MVSRELPGPSRHRALRISRAASTVVEDLRFFDAWEKGLVPNLSGFLRARQIRRGNCAGQPGGLGSSPLGASEPSKRNS